jgi:hypothetical protein
MYRGFAFILPVAAGLLLAISGMGSPANAQTLTVTAQGQIPQTCTVAAGPSFGNAGLNASGSLSTTASVDCNIKFLIRVKSANGGLKTSLTPPSAAFSNSLDYQFSIAVPLDNSAGTLSGNCAASGLVTGSSACALSPAGTGLSSGSATAMGQTASLGVSWTIPAPKLLLAGSYADTLTITVTPQS